jgi:hypothetical protein
VNATAKPVRLQRSRAKGASNASPNGLPVVYVGRPTRWGNPLKVGPGVTREKAVEAFRAAVNAWLSVASPEEIEAFFAPLVGKNLSCWCKPGDACHADVLLEMANP